MSTHILLGFLSDSFKIFWKALIIVIPFLSFKGKIQAYLLKISITHNKNLNHLLNFLINYISAKSAPQIFLNLEQTVLFYKFLIIGLCNSLANCSYNSIGILPPPTVDSLSKNL